MEILAKIGEFLNLKPLYLSAVCLACAALLFLPKAWLVSLGLEHFAKDQKGYVGFAFLLSLALLVCSSVAAIWDHRKKKKSDKADEKAISDLITQLSPYERGFLKLFIDEATKSLTLPHKDAVVQGLVAQQLIYRTGWDHDFNYLYILDTCIWKHLQDHPELLDGAAVIRYR